LSHSARGTTRQNQERQLAAVFILTQDVTAIDGFDNLSALSIVAGDQPENYARKLPRGPIPATLLGRMAVG